MSERFGTCTRCGGGGERLMPIPGFPPTTREVTPTDEETLALKDLRTGADKAKVIELVQRFFVRACYACEGTAGFSGDAMEGSRP